MTDDLLPPAGWYPDPDSHHLERWWSGQDWTERRRPRATEPAAAPAPEPVRHSIALRTVLVAVPVVLLVAVGALTGGLGGALITAGLVALVVGLYTVIRGRSRTFRVRGRGVAAAILVGGLVVCFAGSAAYGAAHPGAATVATTPTAAAAAAAAAPASAPPTSAPASATRTATPTPTRTAAAPAAGSALAVLATLPVKGRAPMTGYVRTAKFGAAWLDVDRNGCDTRDDVLRRDLTDLTGTRCKVASGVLQDPYTGTTIDFTRGVTTSTAVQIDHVVALGDAWQTGAQQLSQAKRIDLANDPINLFAVDGPTNEQKSDADAATWLPPRKAFRCTYVAHQIGVKKSYGLWVTAAEKTAMQRVLATCPTTTAPVSTTSSIVYSGPGATPAAPAKTTASSAPAKAAAPSHPDAGVVHPGSYCSPDGATGRTVKGTPMTCRTTATDSRDRWRSTS